MWKTIFPLVQFLVTHPHSKENPTFFFFLPSPSPIITTFCYPNRALPPQRVGERRWGGSWGGSVRPMRHKADITFACVSCCCLLAIFLFGLFPKVGHCQCSLQFAAHKAS